MESSDFNWAVSKLHKLSYLPLAFVHIAERSFVCNPEGTEHDLEWLSANWVRSFRALSLDLRTSRLIKQLVCLKDIDPAMTGTLDSINERLQKLVEASASKQPVAVKAGPVPTEPAIEVSADCKEDPEVKLAVSQLTSADGKTIGLKLSNEARVRIFKMMEGRNINSYRAGVLLCIEKGLQALGE